ncbi:MAG: ligase-associated DNA damage response endonuclease PdeM [Bacteroidetes bacterium]|nr:ligase-associated DNA damage response endonuclease PdeM [Bacteroidota bacterium]MBS1973782.1 ligase-associated DNA damage response endonuclease PdeM [Bacteroidota bacterium]
MQQPIPYNIRSQQLWLSPERLLFWENEKALVISDLHFGKAGHFRKSGIAIPQSVYKEDLQRLVAQVQYFQPSQLIIVGDLFHSEENMEIELFKKWRENFIGIQLHLIKGNHDILDDEWYRSCAISLSHEYKTVSGFTFIHDISAVMHRAANNYYFSGHVHPGIRINGAGKQSLCFPCFYFGKQHSILPAFSHFTGIALIKPGNDENVFAIVGKKLLQIQ